MLPAPTSPIPGLVDPDLFIAEAERLTNTHDAAGATAVYHHDAVLELVTDGAAQWYRGRDEIADAWGVVLGAGRARGFTVQKTVVAASSSTVVNRWEGTLGGRRACRGIESWTFDAEGLVIEHRAETFLAVRPAESFGARLRLFMAAPGVALAFARAERSVHAARAGRG